MRYKIANLLPPSIEGEKLVLEVVYDTFEEVITKVIRDLNSLWKGSVPFPMTLVFLEVSDDTPLGMRFIMGDKVVATNEKDVIEAMEVQGLARQSRGAL